MQNAFYLRIRKRPTVRLEENPKTDKQEFINAFFPDKEEKNADRTHNTAVKIQY